MSKRKQIGLILVPVLLILCVGGGFMAYKHFEALPGINKALSEKHIRSLVSAARNYRKAHNDEWPDKIEQVAGVNMDIQDYEAFMKNPITGDNPGYEYVKPNVSKDKLKQTIVMYQLRNGQRDTTLPVGFGSALTGDYLLPAEE